MLSSIKVTNAMLFGFIASLLFFSPSLSATSLFLEYDRDTSQIIEHTIDLHQLQWKGASGMHVTQRVEGGLDITGRPSGAWNYALSDRIPLENIQSCDSYKMVCSMKVTPGSTAAPTPYLKFVALDQNGKWLKDYRTFDYGATSSDGWQTLWAEFKLPHNVYQGYLAIGKGKEPATQTAIQVKDIQLLRQSFDDANTESGASPDPTALKPFLASDIVGFTRSSLEEYKDYEVDFVSWGGHPDRTTASINAFCKYIQDTGAAGIKVGAKLGLRTDFKAFIDQSPEEIENSVCRRIDGSAILVPDSEHVTYKGYPAYWFCTNSPAYRDFLFENIRRAMQCSPAGLMIDDPLGTTAAVIRSQGCYCRHCSDGFREYLRDRFSVDALVKIGITDIDGFDLKSFHAAHINSNLSTRPLYRSYLNYQYHRSAELLNEMRAIASQPGRPIVLGANLNPVSASTFPLAAYSDYYSCETRLHSKTNDLMKSESILVYKISDALGRQAAVMGTGEDHAFFASHNRNNQLGGYISEAYAHGHYFMAPIRLWAFDSEKGVHYFQPQAPNNLAGLYRYIKDNNTLFDGYGNLAKVAVVVSTQSFQRDIEWVRDISTKLSQNHIPFDIIMAGLNEAGSPFPSYDRRRHDVIIVPECWAADRDLQRFADQAMNEGGRVETTLDGIPESYRIGIDPPGRITVNLRGPLGSRDQIVVVHLLGRGYRSESDSYQSMKNIEVAIPEHYMPNGVYSGARYYHVKGVSAADRSPVRELTMRRVNHTWIVSVPEIDMWGIIEIR